MRVEVLLLPVRVFRRHVHPAALGKIGQQRKRAAAEGTVTLPSVGHRYDHVARKTREGMQGSCAAVAQCGRDGCGPDYERRRTMREALRRNLTWLSMLTLGLVLAQNPMLAQADSQSALREYLSEANAQEIDRLSYLLFEWPWEDPGIRGFFGWLGVTEKPEPPDDPRAELLELVDDADPDELSFLSYLRRGLEDGQDLATCFDQAEQAACVSRVVEEAERALALEGGHAVLPASGAEQ